MTLFWKISALALAALIAGLSLQAPGDLQSLNHADKVQHFGAYALLCGAGCLGWPKVNVFWVAAGAALFGVGIELAQGMMSLGRTPSILDGVANLAGAISGAIAVKIFRQ